ncbi:hypothetical protein BDV3_005329 [Batrachochytrium dendrobatidis]
MSESISKRRRVFKACKSCKEKRISCSETTPVCKQCDNQQLCCIYEHQLPLSTPGLPTLDWKQCLDLSCSQHHASYSSSVQPRSQGAHSNPSSLQYDLSGISNLTALQYGTPATPSLSAYPTAVTCDMLSSAEALQHTLPVPSSSAAPTSTSHSTRKTLSKLLEKVGSLESRVGALVQIADSKNGISNAQLPKQQPPIQPSTFVKSPTELELARKSMPSHDSPSILDKYSDSVNSSNSLHVQHEQLQHAKTSVDMLSYSHSSLTESKPLSHASLSSNQQHLNCSQSQAFQPEKLLSNSQEQSQNQLESKPQVYSSLEALFQQQTQPAYQEKIPCQEQQDSFTPASIPFVQHDIRQMQQEDAYHDSVQSSLHHQKSHYYTPKQGPLQQQSPAFTHLSSSTSYSAQLDTSTNQQKKVGLTTVAASSLYMSPLDFLTEASTTSQITAVEEFQSPQHVTSITPVSGIMPSSMADHTNNTPLMPNISASNILQLGVSATSSILREMNGESSSSNLHNSLNHGIASFEFNISPSPTTQQIKNNIAVSKNNISARKEKYASATTSKPIHDLSLNSSQPLLSHSMPTFSILDQIVNSTPLQSSFTTLCHTPSLFSQTEPLLALMKASSPQPAHASTTTPHTQPIKQMAIENMFTKPYCVPADISTSKLISVFFKHMWPEFPLLTQDQFLASDMVNSELLMLSIYCNASKYIDPPNEDPNGDPATFVSRVNAGDKYYYKAIPLLGKAIMQTPSYELILAMMYLSSYAAASGLFTGGCVLFASAVRYAQLIGLDNERQNSESFKWSTEEREFRRRIWWTIYELDRYSSQSGHMPMLITNSTPLNTPFPSPDKLVHLVTPATSGSYGTTLNTYTHQPSRISEVSAQSVISFDSGPIFPSISSYRLSVMVISTKVYHLIMNENDAACDSMMLYDTNVFAERRSSISKELMLFRQTLPDWIINVQDYASYTNNATVGNLRLPCGVSMGSTTSVQLAGATVWAFYHHTYISLFMSNFYSMYELGLFDKIHKDATFASSLEAALEVYEITRWLMRVSMHLSDPPPSLCKAIASSACVIHLAHTIGFMGITSDMRNEVLTVFEARLKTMMRFWVWPGQALQIVMAIRHNTFEMNSRTLVWV